MRQIPVDAETVKAVSEGYISLGIVGGAMLLVLIIVIIVLVIFWLQMKAISISMVQELKSVGTEIKDFTKALISNTTKNDSDQAETLRMLHSILDATNDIKKRVVRIDDRTYKCLGNPKKEEA